jgi:hypothetical protein
MLKTLRKYGRWSNNGVGKMFGNAIKTAYGIVGAKTIGHGKDSTLDYYTTS